MIQTKKELLEQLDSLKKFPNNILVRKLRKQISEKLKRLEKKEKEFKQKEEPKIKSNQSRVAKLRKYHRYIRLVRDSFPNLSYSTIRRQFSKRKEGREVSIPDVVWQNPSP